MGIDSWPNSDGESPESFRAPDSDVVPVESGLRPVELNAGKVEKEKSGQDSPAVLEAFRRFERSAAGKFIEIAAAAALGIGGADFMIGKLSTKKAWNEFQQHHPERSEILYQTMADIPKTELESVLNERDEHYVDRVQDGLRDYLERNLPPDATPELRQAVQERAAECQQSLEKFRPSIYDRELTKIGLGEMVRTDRPFPVVRMKNIEDGITGELSPGNSTTPDTIFINPNPSDGQNALQTMEHEYLHTMQFGIKHGLRTAYQPKSEPTGKFSSGRDFNQFNEGANELLRAKLNGLLGREFHPTYQYELTGAQNIEQTVGSDTFWHAYAKGDYSLIERDFNRQLGDQKFSQMFSTGEGIITPFEKGQQKSE